ncbi:DUF1919 domain-containing protein [Lachnospiraceae bacterium 45-P1]
MVKFILSIFDICREAEWIFYKKRKRHKLKNKNVSIIASNCSGTYICHDLRIPYLTPTVNLYIDMNDFIKMVKNLKWYMEQELEEAKEETTCPVGILGDIKIYFMHYASFCESKAKWEERKKRINWDNIFIVGSERDGCTYETIKNFEELPYKNKVIFTYKEYPEFSSTYCMESFKGKGELGVITDFKSQFLKRRYLDDFDYVDFLNHMVEE